MGALSHISTARAQRYLVAEERYRPFEGLPHWLSSRTEDRGLPADIATLEADVHEHKVFDIREPVLLEHRHGYAFLRSGLIQESLTYWQLDTGPTPKGFRDYLAWLINEDSITFMPQAVSLRARWEGNFWHLHDNVLSKLIAIDELDLPDDVPLLVGRPLWETRYFAELRTLPAFRDRNWVLHDRPIRADRMVVTLEGSFRRANMTFVQQSLADAPVAAAPATPELLFLSRSRHRTAHRQRARAHAAPRADAASPSSERSGCRCPNACRHSAPRARRATARRRARQRRAPHRSADRHRRDLPRRQEIRARRTAVVSREFGFAYRAVVGSPCRPAAASRWIPRGHGRAVDAVLDELPHDIGPRARAFASSSICRESGPRAPCSACRAAAAVERIRLSDPLSPRRCRSRNLRSYRG